MSLLQDLPTMIGTMLGFPTSTAAYTGGMILSMAVLLAVALAFAAAMGGHKGRDSNMVMTGTTLFVTMGALYLIGWLPFIFIMLGVLIVGVLFASKAKEGLGI
jgi:hypothetical protein